MFDLSTEPWTELRRVRRVDRTTIWFVGVSHFCPCFADPKKRLPGSVASFVSLFVCMFCTISFGLHVLGFL